MYSHRAAEARASTDALTGLPNRRYFDEFCGLLARRRRAEDAVGVLMVDIDHFKRLNDSYGHDTGDVVLRAVGGAIMAAVREDDVPARYGGEEFVVLLRNPEPGHRASRWGSASGSPSASSTCGDLGVSKVTVSVGVAVAPVPGRADRRHHQGRRPRPVPRQARRPRQGGRRLTGSSHRRWRTGLPSRRAPIRPPCRSRDV